MNPNIYTGIRTTILIMALLSSVEANALKVCTPCLAGTYSNASTNHQCKQCPPDSTSPVGATKIEDCTCTKSHLSPINGNCSCPTGFAAVGTECCNRSKSADQVVFTCNGSSATIAKGTQPTDSGKYCHCAYRDSCGILSSWVSQGGYNVKGLFGEKDCSISCLKDCQGYHVLWSDSAVWD
jgi:hypothetical protein